MSQKEPWNRAFKDDHLYMLVRFQRRDDFVELWNRVWSENIERGVINRQSPVRGLI